MKPLSNQDMQNTFGGLCFKSIMKFGPLFYFPHNPIGYAAPVFMTKLNLCGMIPTPI